MSNQIIVRLLLCLIDCKIYKKATIKSLQLSKYKVNYLITNVEFWWAWSKTIWEGPEIYAFTCPRIKGENCIISGITARY